MVNHHYYWPTEEFNMLNIHSKYSLKYGLENPENIVDWAIDNGYTRLALTDINNTSGHMRFIQYAQDKDFNPVVGIDIRNEGTCCYVLLAQNNRGLHEMYSFLTYHLHENLPFPNRPGYLPNCFIIFPFEHAPKQLLENEWIGINIAEAKLLQVQQHPLQKNKMVMLHSMTFQNKRAFNTHRLLRAIDQNTLLAKLDPKQQGKNTDRFLSRNALYKHYEHLPEVIRNTTKLLQKCHVHFSFGEDAETRNIAHYTGSKASDKALLRQLSFDGVKTRYKAMTSTIRERIEREIDIIEQKGYLSYFLITWDIVHFAKKNGFFHVGRGSGANSIVAYLLHITNVDPLALDLYFERFINLYRKNPPDFDIDFSWKDRDKVMHYIFQRFPNAALLGTYNTFQLKAAVRELGKVFGLPKEEIDQLIEGKKLRTETDEIGQLITKYSQYIVGLPSHLSIHAGGIILSEQPITWYTATFLPPKGFPTTQFSMVEAEEIGLYKYDILSQRGLSKIHDALAVIAYNQPENPPIDIHDIDYFTTDKDILKYLKNGDAMGCFYIESPAMRMLMKKIGVQSYLELVAASSIIRPGVSSSGMMKEYLLRHKNPERRRQAHPTLLSIMPETYGVMVYQEDVIKVAHHFAGLTLDEADILRRGMSGKYRSKSEFDAIRSKYFANCKAKGYSQQLSEDVWRQIESFAGYAFAKGHSASFAVESFQSLYLKVYYPLEYMVATINNGGGYYRPEIYIREAQRLGGIIETPCILNSKWETTIQDKTIYLGFHLVKELQKESILKLEEIRYKEAGFQSFEHFLRSVPINFEQCLILVRLQAFRKVANNQPQLLWRTHLYFKQEKQSKATPSLFLSPVKNYTLPNLEQHTLHSAFEEIELLGFTIRNPFDLLATPVQQEVTAADLPKHNGKIVTCYGYLISIKRTTTNKGDSMYFGHFFDCHGTLFDTVHFPISIQQYPFQGMGIYTLTGTVAEEFDFYSITVKSMQKLPYISDVRYAEWVDGH